MSYQPYIRSAVQKSSFKPERVIVWQRDQLKWDSFKEKEGERDWKRLVMSANKRGLQAPTVAVKSNDGLYIIYTSGK